VLLATRGKPKRLAADVHQVVIAPVDEHSEKPEEVRRRIMRLFPGPYLELYGRKLVPGWTVWGNEIQRVQFWTAEAPQTPDDLSIPEYLRREPASS
jgi:N6-adenosine-specific RNA methylase IME4